jgi:hypothetical protein
MEICVRETFVNIVWRNKTLLPVASSNSLEEEVLTHFEHERRLDDPAAFWIQTEHKIEKQIRSESIIVKTVNDKRQAT